MSAFISDPIVAIATAPGRGGIGIIRIPGTNLQALAQALLPIKPEPRHAHYTPFPDADGAPIDEGIALYFRAPNSYTGEDVLELQGHGGPAVLQRLLKRCMEVGADFGLRHAEPGEFTRRAFLNDRLDLAQAEAVADLIDATSEAAARSAMTSLSGEFSRKVNVLADGIVHLRMLVEATLDFPEEEIEFLEKYQVGPMLQGLSSQLDDLVRQAGQGMILREGLHIVLAGQPNVGKSSLLNALAGDEVAIVTPIAGTTRDRVIQQIHIDGVPLHIVDTAGLRETEDTVERIGIERTWAEIAKADVILHLQDARRQEDMLDSDITSRLPQGTPVITLFNKCDLLDVNERDVVLQEQAGISGGNTRKQPPSRLWISAKAGIGLDTLRQQLLSIAGWIPGSESPWLARERHVQALKESQEHLGLAMGHASHSDQVLDLFAEELRLAHTALTSITGEFTSDDLLGEIFSRFCIGK